MSSPDVPVQPAVSPQSVKAENNAAKSVHKKPQTDGVKRVIESSAKPVETGVKNATGDEGKPDGAMLTVEEQIEATKVADKGIKVGGDPRTALLEIKEMFTGKPDSLERHLKSLESSKDPKDRALAYDFRVAHKQYIYGQLTRLDTAITENKKALENQDLSQVKKAMLINKLENLEATRSAVQERNEIENEAKLKIEIDALTADRKEKFADIPNSFHELGKAFGLEGGTFNSNPLDVIEGIFTMVAQKRSEKDLLRSLKERGLSGDARGIVNEIVLAIRGELTLKEKAKRTVLTGGGIIALLLAFQAWMAGKMNEQRSTA